MRKLLLPLLLACACAPLWAQGGTAKVKHLQSVVFYGLDFTFLKLIHDEGFVDKNGKPMCKSLPFKYFNEWNELFLTEREKFDVSEYYDIPEYTIDQTVATERNKAYATADCIISDEGYRITSEQMTAAVQAYGTDGQAGVGVVVFVESLNKEEHRAVLHSVFFNIADHTVLLIDKQEGAPSGDGFRNYWVNAFARALEESRKSLKD